MTPSQRGGLGALLAVALLTPAARADKALADYRYFRSLSVDLVGRVPTPEELDAFETSSFDVEAFIGQQLRGPGYTERVRRVYQDLLQMQANSGIDYLPPTSMLRRLEIKGPDGKLIRVYGREGQRRARPETRGGFCLSRAEIGLPAATKDQKPLHQQAFRILDPQPSLEELKPVSQELLDTYTTVVKNPWWLYADYRSPQPKQLYQKPAADPLLLPTDRFIPSDGLLFEPRLDGPVGKLDTGRPTVEIRVCNEEASAAEVGTVDAMRPTPHGGIDNYGYNEAHAGETFDCSNLNKAAQFTLDCGCGVGLERCTPVGGTYNGDDVVVSTEWPLGYDQPLERSYSNQSAWWRNWWGQEFVQFIDHILAEDLDFRDLLTAKYTVVNGPLAQFYRAAQHASFAGDNINDHGDGYYVPQSLFESKRAPADLAPSDLSTWRLVPDRGPLASGFLTMPIFLKKYASRRARAQVLWTVFACQDFIATTATLPPSSEPDLTKRDGCSTCHATLEPLAAYFARVREGSWEYLPSTYFPQNKPDCDPTHERPDKDLFCFDHYDMTLNDEKGGPLQGSHASPTNAEAGPAAFGRQLAEDPAFASCVARRVGESFLGHTFTADDASTHEQLTAAFVAGDFKMSALVRAIVTSHAYRSRNDQTGADWRAAGGEP